MTRSTDLFQQWQDAEIALRALRAALEHQPKDSPAYCELLRAVTKAADKAHAASRAFLDEISRAP